MDFVKEFATFLHEKQAIRFGEFTLSSGKKSPYYIDLRVIPSFPHPFRKMVKHLQNKIIDEIGLDNFDCLVSVPTSGLVIASALAIEIVKPLIYVRNKAKEHGTSKEIEGYIRKGMNALMIDDVATSGGSLITAIASLKEAGVVVKDAFVIIDRNEGAKEELQKEGVTMHHLFGILDITSILHEQKLLSDEIFERVTRQSFVH